MNPLFNQITIVGVGLIGGSLGLEIKRKQLAKLVIGCGRTRKNLILAKKRRLIDTATSDLRGAVADADLIILCTPVKTIEKQLEIIATHAKAGALVMDVGSTKELIVKKATQILPNNILFVGAHPLAGTENSGAGAACPNLFKNRVCLLTPSKRNPLKGDFGKIVCFWKTVGARVFSFSPVEHDKYLALTSHLPHMVAFSLIQTIGSEISIKDIKKLSGGGLLDATRIAASPPEMWSHICLANKKSLTLSLKKFTKEIQKIIHLIERDKLNGLNNYFTQASNTRRKLS